MDSNPLRIDRYLVETFGVTRNRAQQLLLSGLVTLDGAVITRASQRVHP